MKGKKRHLRFFRKHPKLAKLESCDHSEVNMLPLQPLLHYNRYPQIFDSAIETLAPASRCNVTCRGVTSRRPVPISSAGCRLLSSVDSTEIVCQIMPPTKDTLTTVSVFNSQLLKATRNVADTTTISSMTQLYRRYNLPYTQHLG